jgi:hypothetical protein
LPLPKPVAYAVPAMKSAAAIPKLTRIAVFRLSRSEALA